MKKGNVFEGLVMGEDPAFKKDNDIIPGTDMVADAIDKKKRAGMGARSKNQYITVEKIEKFLPKGVNKKVAKELAEEINKVEYETGIPEDSFAENVLSYSHLLEGSKYSAVMLCDALKFCTLRYVPMDNEKAWILTFPEKYEQAKIDAAGDQELLNRRIATRVSSYNRGYLVTEITKLMLMPSHISDLPIRLNAMKRLNDLANGVSANGERVGAMAQVQAISKIMDITEQPVDKKIQLEISASDKMIAAQEELSGQMSKMVAQQAAAFRLGMDVKEVQNIYVGMSKNEEVIDVDTE